MSKLAAELEELGGADITAALEEVPVRAFVIDRDGAVRWQNAASRRAIGDRTGEFWPHVPTPTWSDEVAAFVNRVVCSGEPAEFSFEVVETDGRTVTREISAAPLREGGAVVGIFGLSTPGTPTRPRPDGGGRSSPTLTDRQLEVLRLLAEGKSTGQIADELVLRPTTVRNHIAHVLANLGVHTRVQAVIAASKAGLIQLP